MCRVDKLATILCWLSRNCGSLNLLSRPVQEFLYLYLLRILLMHYKGRSLLPYLYMSFFQIRIILELLGDGAVKIVIVTNCYVWWYCQAWLCLLLWIIRSVIIIIITIIIISFMQCMYTYIPETNYVSSECSVAAILLLPFMFLISLVSVLNLLYFYISTFRSLCAVPNMAVFSLLLFLFLLLLLSQR